MKLVACFGFKYEPEWLIADLRANIASIADEVFEFDSRSRQELWIPREEFNGTLRRGAIERDADYMLVIAPDERLEQGAGRIIRALVARGKPVSYRFNLREMFTPTAYRVDGIWGKKRRVRLHYMRGKSTTQNVDVNLYHLKMIEPQNRISRAELHAATNTVDNIGLGFDYMTDESGLELEEIPPGREFYPPYTRPYIFGIPERFRQLAGK